jgi:hypothetical protein
MIDYTPEQLEVIKKHWSYPPKECKGACKMFAGPLLTECLSCGWDDFNNTTRKEDK